MKAWKLRFADRDREPVAGFLFIAVCLFGFAWSPPQYAAGQIANLQGEMAGEVTATSAILQSRLTAPALDEKGDLPGADGVARFEISTHPGFRDTRVTSWATADAAGDHIVKQKVTGLDPGTRYYYRLVYGPSRERPAYGPTRTFRTLPAADDPKPVSFVVVTGMHFGRFHNDETETAEDKQLGFPALEAIRALRPDFFVGTGDNVYYDHYPPADALPDLRKKWHEQFVQPRFVSLFAEVPTFWEKDDHDYRYNDADTTGERLPGHRLGIELFLEQVPVTDPEEPGAVTYRTHRAGELLQIWLLEGRDYRSPNSMPDGPVKTLWGTEQRTWLKETLLASTAAFKIIISPTPLVGPDDAYKKDNHTNQGGFRYEGEAFLEWAREHGLLERGLYIVCGDRHWQYHSVHPTGFEEFSTGALVDGNSRMGRPPGDPESTDPEALIRQPFTSPEPSGGFLHVAVEPGAEQGSGSVHFTFFDDEGRQLYRVTRR
jgi:alkaline phosphatase D